MASTATAPAQLRRGAKVVSTTDLRGVPEGTAGKVMLVNGLTWMRYWVRFANGVELGTIDRSALATPAEIEDRLNGGGALALDAVDDEGADEQAGAADSSGGVATPSGTLVPQLLLDRSAAARVRLGG